MASTDKIVPEAEKQHGHPPPPEVKTTGGGSSKCCKLSDVVLRVLLFAVAVAAVVVMVTSKQTETFPQQLPFPPFPTITLTRTAKFDHSPAFIYFVVALSVAGLYGLITSILSGFVSVKPNCSSIKSVLHLIIFDLILFGIVTAALGAAGGVAYIGLKGNNHVGWMKVCNRFDAFCHHVAASVFLSLIASIILLLLVLFSVFSLSRKISKS